jgi:hypothetical protein
MVAGCTVAVKTDVLGDPLVKIVLLLVLVAVMAKGVPGMKLRLKLPEMFAVAVE